MAIEAQVGLLPHLGANVFKVERILTHKSLRTAKHDRTGIQYLVAWHGYGSDDWSWVPKRDFVCPEGSDGETAPIPRAIRHLSPLIFALLIPS